MPETANGWLDLVWKAISILGLIVAVFIIPWLQTKFATKKDHDALSLTVGDHSTRLTKIEASMPTKDQMAEVLRKLEALSGAQSTNNAHLEGLQKIEARSEGRLARIEEHLLQTKVA